MVLRRSSIIILLLFIIFSCINAQVTKEQINKAIDQESLHHPYLYFNEKDQSEILNRIQNDPESRDLMAMFLAEANRLMFTPVEEDVPTRDKHPRYWTDGKYDSYVSRHVSAAHLLAFIYQMTGDEKYARKSFEFAEAICALQSWTYVAHEFPIIYSRVWPRYVDDDQVVFNFDIRVVYMAHYLSAVYDWIYPTMTKRQRDRIRGALLEKVILPVRGNYEYHWDANCFACNHCQLFCSGTGVTALTLLTENPELVDVVTEAYNRMNKVYEHIGIDGGWQEGPAYWAYGMANSIYFMDALKRVTDGKYNLFAHPRIKEDPATFLLYGITTDFGDSPKGVKGATWLLNKLTEETGDGLAAWYRKHYFGEGNTIYDIIWHRSSVTPVKPGMSSKHFRSIDWVVMQSAFDDPEQVVVACKAGMNDDPHHGHLDVGQFVINWRGQAFIRDIGRLYPYDEKYFDNIRFEYPQVSSLGHNLVFVNGECQVCAKYKDQPWREGIGGKVLEFRTSEERDYTLMDPTNAYEKKQLNGWRRHIILEKPVITVVVDEVRSEMGVEIETRFHSEVETEFKDKFVLLKGENGTMALIPVLGGDFSFRPGKHANLPVKKDIKFEWIPYFGTVFQAKNENTVIATLIMPVKDEGEALDILGSIERKINGEDNLVLSFNRNGEVYSYLFKKQKHGLLLSD
jgi:hypothetical protein